MNKLSPVSIYKYKGEWKIGKSDAQVNACDGIKMIEQAYSFVRNNYGEENIQIVANDKFLMNKQMQELEGSRVGATSGEVPSLFKNGECITYYSNFGLTLNSANTPEEALDIMARKLETNPNVFGSLHFSKEVSVDNGKSLVDGHQYRIIGYDKKAQINQSRKELIKELVGKENITTQEYLSVRNHPEILKIENQIRTLEGERQVKINNVEGFSELRQIDSDYIRRLDNIKSQIGNEPLTFEKLKQIDSEFAKAYNHFLSIGKSEGEKVEHILLDSDGLKWNEIIISNPQVVAISTTDFKHLSTEYLIKSQKDNIPIVIID